MHQQPCLPPLPQLNSVRQFWHCLRFSSMGKASSRCQICFFSASLALGQRRISSKLRRQPIQFCSASNLHWLIQGEGSGVMIVKQAKGDFTPSIDLRWVVQGPRLLIEFRFALEYQLNALKHFLRALKDGLIVRDFAVDSPFLQTESHLPAANRH